jgi:hypothetical protein
MQVRRHQTTAVPTPLSPIQTELGEPILFRTTGKRVYEGSLTTGSVWLRSDGYYRELEDKVRNDSSEGANPGTTSVPLRVLPPNGPELNIQGSGQVGQLMVPHYLISLHGSSIAPSEREAFGGHTFGIRSLSRLSAEVLYQCSKQIKCTGYRYGHIYYQYVAFAISLRSGGGAAIQLGESPAHYLNPVNIDVLRKRPIKPFIDQDEWRIVIFTDGYVGNDASLPLKINVATAHFFPYLVPGGA